MISLVAFNVGFNAPVRAPVPQMKAASSEFCYGLPGALPPVGNFDPLNLLKDKSFEQVKTLREAELTHGRVGMLASAGFLVQEKFHPLFSADGGPAIEQIPQLPVFMWFAMTLGIGISEGYRVNLGWSSPTAPDHFFQKLEDDCEAHRTTLRCSMLLILLPTERYECG